VTVVKIQNGSHHLSRVVDYCGIFKQLPSDLFFPTKCGKIHIYHFVLLRFDDFYDWHVKCIEMKIGIFLIVSHQACPIL
jgi:hypothetical protein